MSFTHFPMIAALTLHGLGLLTPLGREGGEGGGRSLPGGAPLAPNLFCPPPTQGALNSYQQVSASLSDDTRPHSALNFSFSAGGFLPGGGHLGLCSPGCCLQNTAWLPRGVHRGREGASASPSRSEGPRTPTTKRRLCTSSSMFEPLSCVLAPSRTIAPLTRANSVGFRPLLCPGSAPAVP